MGKREQQSKNMLTVFTFIVKRMIMPTFSFHAKGGIAIRTLNSCLDALEKEYGDDISVDRIVDFCVCQAYVLERYEGDFKTKWSITHSFGTKALERFRNTTKGQKYYEDKWMSEKNLSRLELRNLIASKKSHPHYKFLFPSYEEGTKLRMINTEMGYYICGHSTLLWTPFSPACQQCTKASMCQQRTQKEYPELYRIRIEEYKENEAK